MTSDRTKREVRAEYLAPAELDAAMAANPVAFVPLGSLEFHGAHLPIGLDALNAHGVCVATAERVGGIVLPPLYQGTGGGHADYPWTIMMRTDAGIRSHLDETLRRLEAFGTRLAVLFTGHFADEQLTLIDEIATAWHNTAWRNTNENNTAENNTSGHTMQVLATGVNRCPSAPIAPDHAGVFETSLLFSLWPQLVHLDRLPSASEHPSVDPGGDDQGAHRHDPGHPLWGVFGPDPRDVDLDSSNALLESLASWLASEVAGRL